MDLDCESEIMKSDEEISRGDKPSGTSASNHNHYSKNKGGEQRRMVDITRDKPIKVAVRVVVPVRDHPKFNFVGKLLGPKGNSLKRLQEDTMCKMAVLGRGSMKDRHKEEELRASGDPKFQHLSEELHVEISAFATPAEAHARIAYALAEVRRFLVPDYNDDIRQEQMWEMQVLSSQRGNAAGKNDEGNGEPSSMVEYATISAEDRLSAVDTMEGGPESPQQGGEHPALRGVQPVVSALSVGIPETQASTITVPVTSLPPHHPNTNSVGIISCTTPNINNNSSNSNNSSGTNSAVGGQLSPGANNATVAVGANVGTLNAGRKRPLLAGGPRTSMTPTKRTVMSLLARARAAQAKQLPATFQRGTPERSTTLVPLLREDYITGAVNLNLI